MVKIRLAIFFLPILTVLAGCATISTEAPSAIPTATSQPSSTATLRPTQTNTPEITLQPSATPTFSLERQIFETQLAARNQQFAIEQTQIANFPYDCGKNGSFSLISPDETWAAIACEGNTKNLKIINLDGKSWFLKSDDYLSKFKSRYSMEVRSGLYPEYWTKDGENLYFSSQVAFDGGGCCFYTPGVNGLFRINVNTGVVTPVLPELFGWGYDFSFSPDGHWLVYFVKNPVMVDLTTGEVFAIDMEDISAGYFTWSPDGSQLAFATCDLSNVPMDSYPDITETTVKIYSPETRQLQTIYTSGAYNHWIRISEFDQYLEIRDDDSENSKHKMLYYNWSTRRFTSTPLP